MAPESRPVNAFELRFDSSADLERAFCAVIDYEFLGHCEVRRGDLMLRFSTQPGRETELLRRLLRARGSDRLELGMGPALSH